MTASAAVPQTQNVFSLSFFFLWSKCEKHVEQRKTSWGFLMPLFERYSGLAVVTNVVWNLSVYVNNYPLCILTLIIKQTRDNLILG